MTESGNAVATEKSDHYLVSQYRYPVGDQVRFEDTASKYLTDLLIDDKSLASAINSVFEESEVQHAPEKRFLFELEILAAAADPKWAP